MSRRAVGRSGGSTAHGAYSDWAVAPQVKYGAPASREGQYYAERPGRLDSREVGFEDGYPYHSATEHVWRDIDRRRRPSETPRITERPPQPRALLRRVENPFDLTNERPYHRDWSLERTQSTMKHSKPESRPRLTERPERVTSPAPIRRSSARMPVVVDVQHERPNWVMYNKGKDTAAKMASDADDQPDDDDLTNSDSDSNISMSAMTMPNDDDLRNWMLVKYTNPAPREPKQDQQVDEQEQEEEHQQSANGSVHNPSYISKCLNANTPTVRRAIRYRGT